MFKNLIIVSFILMFVSVSACAQEKETQISKRKCLVDKTDKAATEIIVDGAIFSFGINRLSIKKINIFNETLKIILMSDTKEIVFISVIPSHNELLLDARKIASKSPFGRLSELEDLYGSSPFGIGINTVFESDNYGSFLVVETGGDSRVTRLIGSGNTSNYVAEISINPALPCGEISVSNVVSSEDYKGKAVGELSELVSNFINGKDIESDIEKLKGKKL